MDSQWIEFCFYTVFVSLPMHDWKLYFCIMRQATIAMAPNFYCVCLSCPVHARLRIRGVFPRSCLVSLLHLFVRKTFTSLRHPRPPFGLLKQSWTRIRRASAIRRLEFERTRYPLAHFKIHRESRGVNCLFVRSLLRDLSLLWYYIGQPMVSIQIVCWLADPPKMQKRQVFSHVWRIRTK